MPEDPTDLPDLDPEIADRMASRRDALRTMSGAFAALSVPVAFAASARAAFAQGGGSLPRAVVDVLNFALVLERLESAFYAEGLERDGLIPAKSRVVFETIRAHEREHVELLEKALGDDAGEAPGFDFTAGGEFDTFERYETFLLLSQAFEDTGQRAYRGQAGALAGSPEILTQALTIHSVEARHAAQVRLLRGEQGWIAFAQPGAPAPIRAVYRGMSRTTKYERNVRRLVPDIGARQITESFDEPLTKSDVLEIVEPFIR